MTVFTSTQLVFENGDMKVVIGGSGFATNGVTFSGTITSAKAYEIDTSSGTSVDRLQVQSTSALSLSLQGLFDAIESSDWDWGGFDYLLSGHDSITGTAGSDDVDAAMGNDTVRGLDGNDSLYGDFYYSETPQFGGADLLDGGNGNDELHGGGGNDTLLGGAGDDLLNGEWGADSMVGGAGNDYYLVSAPGDIVVEEVNGGLYDRVSFTTQGGMSAYTLSANVENLDISHDGGPANFTGSGNLLANRITVIDYGYASSEVLQGLGGNDRLSSGSGNDTLDGGTGNDTLLGGSGSDTYLVDALGDVVSESLIGGSPADADTVVIQIAGAATYSLGGTVTGLSAAKAFAGIENLTLGSATALNAIGSTAANVLTGNAGANRLFGLGGNDSLLGGAGNDSLDGGADADVLTGGTGADTLVGGAGNDRFVFNAATDTGKGSAALRDVISDFAVGDLVDLRGIDANATLAGDQAFTFIGSSAFGANATGQLRYAGGVLYGSTNADTAAEFEIAVTLLGGRTAMAVNDFLL
ncbi:calcium-binding protein [Azohydromonas aeria]|uniref:calcium-binding protein n=1 Tax=Azohydromonas aeria TaxID=2590212 RepID=UPI0028737581|nr:calcium-binding protein [Azohydromonas aeria]